MRLREELEDLVPQGLVNETALVMYSGGLDSFLTAIELIHSGYNVKLISFNNGSMIGIDRVFGQAKRLINVYGEARVEHVGVYPVTAYKSRLSEHIKYSSPVELINKYPNIPYYQLECLCCHTAMYISAIAYCKSHGITTLAEGARISQGFIVEVPEMLEVYTSICNKHGIKLELPVLNIPSDEERALELSHYNFIPKTFEPQCTLGLPLRSKLSQCEIDQLVTYFNEQLYEIVEEGITSLIPILRMTRPRLSMNGFI